jgi:Rrf2 family protein
VTQGKNGGYLLARPAEKILLYEIVQIHENLDELNQCLLGENHICKAPGCRIHNLWSKQREQIKDFLYKNNLSTLASGRPI